LRPYCLPTTKFFLLGTTMNRSRDDDREDDWGDDKETRENRYKQRKAKKDKDVKKDPPMRADRTRPRNGKVKWYGDDYDYQEEYGE
jgi:hypothetical protein